MPRRVQPLNAKRLEAVRPRDDEIVELGDGHLPGLRVRISRGGRFWSLNIRNSKGERRRFDVGDNLSLAEARRRAEILKQTIKQGGDPTGERRDARRRVRDAKSGIGTFGSVVNAYFDGDGSSLRTKDEQRARIRFDPLYRDLEAGGYSEFLWFLQNLQLGDWHPREIIKTAEATEQQRMNS